MSKASVNVKNVHTDNVSFIFYIHNVFSSSYFLLITKDYYLSHVCAGQMFRDNKATRKTRAKCVIAMGGENLILSGCICHHNFCFWDLDFSQSLNLIL